MRSVRAHTMQRALAPALLLASASCSLVGYEHHRALGSVEIYPSASHAYQLRVPYRVEARGSPHDPFDYAKREFEEADWIPLEASGLVSPDDSYRRPCPETGNRTYGSQQIRGSVVLRDSSATLQLQVPSSDSRHPGWVDYEFNGSYPLVRPTHPAGSNSEAQSDGCLMRNSAP
jgi:hypothetical protein